MAISLKDNRWAVTEADFAARITIPDIKGFFSNLPIIGSAPKSRTLVIEPGTRALVIDEGMVIGEVLPGEYTLEGFLERLRFWRKKQTTVILTRQEDVPIDSQINAPCLEGVFIEAEYRWTIQINDILPFINNLMGAQDSISVARLKELLSAVMAQAVRDSIGDTSYENVGGADFRERLITSVRIRVDARLKRYGLLFQDIQSFHCLNVDEVTKKRGEVFFKASESQLQKAVAEIENNELKARLEVYQSKVPVREALRDVVTSDKIDELKNAEDFKQAVAEIDKQRVLRKEDVDTLVEGFKERKEDRSKLREHLLESIDLQREQELDSLRVDLDHTVRMQSLEKEIELARLSRSADAEQWRADIERNKEEAQHHWQQKHEKIKSRWERIREDRRQNRDDSWEELLHQQKMEEVRDDLELARADRQRKVAILEAELQSRLEAEKLEIQKRQQEWEHEAQERKSLSQIERLQKVQEMNAKFVEQQQRMQVEMENLKADSDSKRELDRIKALGGLSTEALVATASAENAALLADLKKHEASQEAAKVQATSNPSADLDQERLRMYEKMTETERAKADAIAEAYKAAMQTQTTNVEQMIGGLAQAATPPSQPVAMPPAVPPPTPAAEVWYVSLNGQQSTPLPFTQVQQYIQSGQVNAATMVWKTGMSGWMAAGQVPDLAPYLPATGPPGPPPS
jgi:hypothetical protein